MRRSRKINTGGGDGHGGDGGDLMITPLLDLFIALIPFLIISMVLTQINVVDVGVAKPVKAATQAKDEIRFDLLVRINDKNVDVVFNAKSLKSIQRDESGNWIEAVRASLVEIKKKYPDQYRIRIEPQGKVTLQTVMSFMDSARKLKAEDGEILGKDENGKPVKLQFLFPNIVLRGVYG